MSNSVYRVFTLAEMIMPDSLSYGIISLKGLQCTVTMQAMTLSLSLIRMMTLNDFGLREWTGIGNERDEMDFPHYCEVIKDVSSGALRVTKPTHLYRSVDLDTHVRAYYGYGWGSREAFTAYPVHYMAMAAWNKYFDTPLPERLPASREPLYGDVDEMKFGIVTTLSGNNTFALSVLAGTTQITKSLPVTY